MHNVFSVLIQFLNLWTFAYILLISVALWRKMLLTPSQAERVWYAVQIVNPPEPNM